MTNIMIILYNAFIVGGTAYLIAIHDWSPWWFIVTALFFMVSKERK